MTTTSNDAARLLGERLRRRREQLGLPQDDAARLSRVNPSHYGKVERGEVNTTLKTLLQIAIMLELELESLVRGLDDTALFPAPKEVAYSALDFMRDNAPPKHTRRRGSNRQAPQGG